MSGFFEAVLNKPKYEKSSVTDYVRLDYDKAIKVQLLPVPPGEVHTHWLQGRKLPVRCLGMNCPVCARNESLDYDKTHDDFVAKNTSYVMNVLDLTPSKICPKCSYINEKNAIKCTNEECDEVLVDVDVQPMNMVRYFEASYTLTTRINETLLQTLESYGLEATEANICSIPISIKKFKASNDKTDYTVVPQPKSDVDLSEYVKKAFDPAKTGIIVDYPEMMALMAGTSLKEVMKARSNEPANKEKVESIFDI